MTDFLFLAIIFIGVLFLFSEAVPTEISLKNKMTSLIYWGYILILFGFAGLLILSSINNQNKFSSFIDIKFDTSIVDIIKGLSAYAWPASAIIIAFSYRSDIRSLLNRLRKAGKEGFELDPENPQATSENSNASAIDINQIAGTPTKATQDLEDELNFGLNNIQPNARSTLAVRLLAQTRLELHFERVYHAIFGSQINTLYQLRDKSFLDIKQIRAIYEIAEKQYPEIYAKYQFDGWLSFLKNQHLIIEHASSIQISPIGRDFLQHIFVRHLNINKHG